MQFNYKQADTSVNVSKVSPLKRAIQLFSGLLLTLVSVYFLLGLLVNVVAPYVPKTLEDKMGASILAEWPVQEDAETVMYYEGILEKLIGSEEAGRYAVRIIEMEEVNAFAVPGDIIVFSSTFVEEFAEEETIAFVLGHELGHFSTRDHIKGYGRAMVLYAISAFVSGNDSSSSMIISDILAKTETKFSQHDELKADAYGATLVSNAYGTNDGGIDFFEMLSEEYEQGQLASYFDTHPHPEKRIEAIKKLKLNE